jgi:hypothetical protein
MGLGCSEEVKKIHHCLLCGGVDLLASPYLRGIGKV